MRDKLTHLDTLGLNEVGCIGGDLLLLPEQQELSLEGRQYVFTLERQYGADVFRLGQEPAWVENIPEHLRTQLRFDFTIRHEDPLAIMGIFPHTGISYMVREGGLCAELEQMFGLWRLQGIRQLGFLQEPWFGTLKNYAPIAEHTRLMHTLDVMAVASLIAYNNNFRGWRLNTLRTAAMLHDMGTPAGGDSVKLVDLEALDEDKNFRRLLRGFPERHRVWKKYRIKEGVLIKAIQGRGLLGELLNMADKIAYVARDLEACRPFIEYGKKYLGQRGLHMLLTLLEEHPNICGIWDSVRVLQGLPVFTDPKRLAVFLKIRTLLFRELYYHPHARFGEYLVSRVLVKTLYKQGKITRDELLDMRDWELEKRINEAYPGRYEHWKSVIEIVSEGAQCRSFQTRETAECFLQELRSQGNAFALLEDNRQQLIKTGTDFLVPTKKGPRPFREAYSDEAQEIEELARRAPSIHVYYLEGELNLSQQDLAEIMEANVS